MKRILFLTSGNGGTLKFTYFAIKKLKLDYQIVAVFADRECGALEFASNYAIPNKLIPYSRSSPLNLQDALKKTAPDIIVTNFHKIIDEQTLSLFPRAFINLHYSLLPAFGGLIGMSTLDAAERANTKFVGASCHSVIPEVDAGTIISQCSTAVDWKTVNKTALIDAIFKSACLTFLNGIIDSYDPPSTSIIKSQQFQFNPGLSFSTSVFDDDFWSLIKNS